MKKYSILIIILVFSTGLIAEKNYLDSLFVKDKIKLYKEAYSKIRRSQLTKNKQNYRIEFVYGFEFSSGFLPYESIGNAYLKNIKPVYKYSNFLFNRKVSLKKRLTAMGYIFNEKDSIVAIITSEQNYPFKVFPYSDSYSIGVYNVFIKNKFDLVFYVGFLTPDIWWCIKGDRTLIYDVNVEKFYTFDEFYKCCWKKYRPMDIITFPKIKFINQQ